jgi:hypothetical protein
MPDPKRPASAARPERLIAHELRRQQPARRPSERLVAEWLRRLSIRRS